MRQQWLEDTAPRISEPLKLWVRGVHNFRRDFPKWKRRVSDVLRRRELHRVSALKFPQRNHDTESLLHLSEPVISAFFNNIQRGVISGSQNFLIFFLRPCFTCSIYFGPILKAFWYGPGWCSSVGWALDSQPKRSPVSRSRRMPGLWARSLVRGLWDTTDSLSLPFFLWSLKINLKKKKSCPLWLEYYYLSNMS